MNVMNTVIIAHTNSKLIGYRTQSEGKTHKKSEMTEMIKRNGN